MNKKRTRKDPFFIGNSYKAKSSAGKIPGFWVNISQEPLTQEMIQNEKGNWSDTVI